MPIFEYACQECDNTYEKIVMRSRSQDNQTCPACGSEHSKKLMSSFSSKTSTSGGYSAPVSSGGGGGFS